MSGETNYNQPGREPEGTGGKKHDYSYGSHGFSKSKSLGIIILVLALLVFQITVFVAGKLDDKKEDPVAGQRLSLPDTVYRDSMPAAPAKLRAGKSNSKKRMSERFSFDPNTISPDSLCRLGFSPKQAQSILNYRNKGGSFRKKEDFAKMYVVSEILYRQLEPYIVLPGIDTNTEVGGRDSLAGKKWAIELNAADSASLVKLYGIGGYYARRILQYRTRLGSFYAPEQLMEIEGIDSIRFHGFRSHVTVDSTGIRRFSLDTAGKIFLGKHPYVGAYAARGILLLREKLGTAACTLEMLVKEKVLLPAAAARLRPYIERHPGEEVLF